MAIDNAARMLAARREWFELDEPPRRALQLQRPGTAARMRYQSAIAGAQDETRIDALIKIATIAVNDWRGVTEADLLGAAIGSDVVAPFAADVFALWLDDNFAEVSRIVTRVFEMVRDHDATREDVAKN